MSGRIQLDMWRAVQGNHKKAVLPLFSGVDFEHGLLFHAVAPCVISDQVKGLVDGITTLQSRLLLALIFVVWLFWVALIAQPCSGVKFVQELRAQLI